MSNSAQDPETELMTIFRAAVDAVSGELAVLSALNAEPVEPSLPVYLLAVGKAADAMVAGVVKALPKAPVKGLMITKEAHASENVMGLTWLRVIESSHPVPNESSLLAGRACIDFVKSVPTHSQLLVLMSGGTSSLVESLIDGLTLKDVQRLNETLIAGGLPIDAMNRVRKTVSSIKGGKLSSQLPPEVRVRQLVISDVPGDKLSDIGSGLLAMPEPGDFAHPGDLIDALPVKLDDNLVACVNAYGVRPPEPTADVWQQIKSTVAGSSHIAQEAAACAAKALNVPVIQSSGSLHGDVNVIAERIAQTLVNDTRLGVYIWGGETHLVLPEKPGRGGRNQHLALAVALRIAGEENLSVLCCGTDGSDGPTADAGGLVTGESIGNGSSQGLLADDYLQAADAGSYLAAVNALVTTGPTGTNVMDLVVAVRSG